MDVNGDAIYGTRSWKIFGEGPTQVKAGMFNEGATRFSAADIRFTTKGKTLYAFSMGQPANNSILVKSLAAGSPYLDGRKIKSVSLLGYKGKLEWQQTGEGLQVKMPAQLPGEHAVVLQISGIL